MTESPPTEPVFDPFAPGFTDDPYPHYAEMREHAPVHRHPSGSGCSPGTRTSRGCCGPDSRSRSATWPRATLSERCGRPRTATRCRGSTDGPCWTGTRRTTPACAGFVSKAFTPRALRALRPQVVDLVDGMLDAMARARHVDLIESLAFPLPFAVIAKMLGTPSSDHERIRELTGVVVRSLEPVADPDLVSAIVSADHELGGIAAEMIAWKRENPADDLLTALINAEDEGDVLDEDELIAQTLLLYIAGHETTVSLIGGGTLALLRDPGQTALLRDDPGLVANAVEEMLRYDSPVQASRLYHRRTGHGRGRRDPCGRVRHGESRLGQQGRAFLGAGRRRAAAEPRERPPARVLRRGSAPLPRRVPRADGGRHRLRTDDRPLPAPGTGR